MPSWVSKIKCRVEVIPSPITNMTRFTWLDYYSSSSAPTKRVIDQKIVVNNNKKTITICPHPSLFPCKHYHDSLPALPVADAIDEAQPLVDTRTTFFHVLLVCKQQRQHHPQQQEQQHQRSHHQDTLSTAFAMEQDCTKDSINNPDSSGTLGIARQCGRLSPRGLDDTSV